MEKSSEAKTQLKSQPKNLSNVVVRTLTGLLLGFGSLFLLFLSRELFSLEVILLILYGLREFYKVTLDEKVPLLQYIGYISGIGAGISAYYLDLKTYSHFALAILMLSFLVVVIVQIIQLELKGRGSPLPPNMYIKALREASIIVISQLYISIPFSFAILFSREPELLLALLLSIFSVDIFAYFSGKTIGRKLIKKGFFNTISPNKTWEGTIVGVLTSWVITFLYVKIYFRPMRWDLIAVLWLIAIIATISDLAESALKRGYEIKDTDNIIFGHGGILDRFDSYILSAWVFWLYNILLLT